MMREALLSDFSRAGIQLTEWSLVGLPDTVGMREAFVTLGQEISHTQRHAERTLFQRE